MIKKYLQNENLHIQVQVKNQDPSNMARDQFGHMILKSKSLSRCLYNLPYPVLIRHTYFIFGDLR